MTINPSFHIVIPARYQSSRFPGKLLEDLGGMTVLERVYRQALRAEPSSLCIATDHPLIYDLATSFATEVVMTSPLHPTGTDRIAEVAWKQRLPLDAIIVNVQGDEPFIEPGLIQQVALSLANSKADMSTLCWPIRDASEASNPNTVKVVRDKENYALYFSRASIPAYRDQKTANCLELYRHIGLYAYRVGFLLDLVKIPPCALEEAEALEQLRALWAGYKIIVEEACVEPLQDINSPEDLTRAKKYLELQGG